MKLMLVGRSARGKTTLLNKITEKGWTSSMPRWGEREQRPKAGGDTPVTVGIAVSNWTYMSRHASKGRVRRITFKTWDFAGQVSVVCVCVCHCVCVCVYVCVFVCVITMNNNYLCMSCTHAGGLLCHSSIFPVPAITLLGYMEFQSW